MNQCTHKRWIVWLLLVAVLPAAACAAGAERSPAVPDPVLAAGPTAVTIAPTNSVTPLPTASSTPAATPVPSVTPSVIPSATPTFTPTPALLAPELAGLVFSDEGGWYRVEAAGETVPWGGERSPDGRYQLVINGPLSSPDNLFLLDTETGVRHSPPLPPLQSVRVADWWPAEPAWILLAYARQDEYFDGPPPYSGLLNVADGRFISLGSYAAPLSQGRLVYFLGSLFGEPDPDGRDGLWLFDLADESFTPLPFADFGLDLDAPPLDRPVLSADGRYLALQCYWWFECETVEDRLLLFDLAAGQAKRLSFRYLGPEGPIYSPQWSPAVNELLVMGMHDEQYGSWRITPTGEVLDFWENRVYPLWISPALVALRDDGGGGGWRLVDLESGAETPLPSRPIVSGDGRFLAGTRLRQGVTDAPVANYSWLFDLAVGDLREIPLPPRAFIRSWE